MITKLIIGGASKSGTTALYYYLRQHPEICLPAKKELHFFSRDFLQQYKNGPGDRFVLAEIPKSYEEFIKNFTHCDHYKVQVDISPSYLFHFHSADKIKQLVDNVKVVFILRNPADKVFSQYTHLIGEGRETLTFEDALEAESSRKSEGYSDMWLYKKSGYYSDAIEYFHKKLGKDNVKIYFYEEFLHDPGLILREICNFAGVNENVEFQPVVDANRSGSPKSTFVAKLLAPNNLTYLLRRILPQSLGRIARKTLKDLNTGKKQEFSRELRSSLLSEYSEDIRKLEQLVGRSSGWIK